MTEREDTLRDLAHGLYEARNAYAVAERAKIMAEERLREFMEDEGLDTHVSEEHHVRLTIVRQSRPKVSDNTEFMAALTELGTLPKYKKTVDTSWLGKLLEVHGGEFPGVAVSNSAWIKSTGLKS